MLFHAGKVLVDRRGQPVRQPKPNEKPRRDEKTNEIVGFDDDQLRDTTHAEVALQALDSTLHGDEDEMKKDPAKWVKAVNRREEISRPIAESVTTGDGWVEIDVAQRDLLEERLAKLVVLQGLRMVGPVLEALKNPPKERPKKPGKPARNGKVAEDTRQESPGLA
jgi:hypothetical protein